MPEQIGPYRVEAKLGEGGMGIVYRAYDTRLHRRVALKMLRAGAALNAIHRERFLREARAASALNHPNICTVHDVGESEGEPYLVLEYLEGETLSDRLQRGPLPIDDLLKITAEAAAALSTAHKHGIIHRDIKPGNVFLTAQGPSKVMDFGLAKIVEAHPHPASALETSPLTLTEVGSAMGTLLYMSPEQARGEEVDIRTDLFSFGVMLYEMAAGVRPFRGATQAAVCDAILNREPVPVEQLRPDLPAPLAKSISQALRKDRAERIQSAAEILTPLPGAAIRSSVRSKPAWRPLYTAAAIVALILAAAAAWTFWPAPRIQSLAVLPFDAAEGSSADFGLALSEAISDDLTRAGGLKILPRATTRSYQATSKPAEEIARELGVDAALKGSLLKDGEQLSFALDLISTDGRRLWSKQYKPESNGIFAMQRSVVSDVLAAAGIGSAGAADQSPVAAPLNAEAYDLYLRGLSHTWRQNEKDTTEAIALLEKAAALDPKFPPIQAALALAYGNMSFYYRPEDPQWEDRGFAAVQRTLAMDPDAPEAHLARAVMLWRPSHAFPSRDALAELRKALAVQPNMDEAWHQHGLILLHVGHLQPATRDIEEALRINPANAAARFRFGPILVYMQRFDEALAALNRVPRESVPTQWAYQRAWALISLNRLDEADREVEESLKRMSDQGGVLHACRAMIRAIRGDRRGAEADIAEARRVGSSFGHFHHTAYSIGAVYTLLGEFDKAQEWIETASNTGFPNFTLFETDLHLAKLREVPKFQSFLKQLRAEWEHIPGEE